MGDALSVPFIVSWSFYIEQLLNAATNEVFLLQLSHDPNTTFPIMLMMKIKNICTKNKLALRKKVITKRGEINW